MGAVRRCWKFRLVQHEAKGYFYSEIKPSLYAPPSLSFKKRAASFQPANQLQARGPHGGPSGKA